MRWKMRVWSLAVFAAMVAGSAAAQVQEMTPERISEAITLGKAKKGGPGHYEIPGTKNSWFTTPFSRVTDAAAKASAKYLDLDAATLPNETAMPVIVVTAGPEVAARTFVEGVEAVVILPSKDAPREQAIQPISSREYPDAPVFSRGVGMRLYGKALIATFPLTALRDGSVIRIVYRDGKERGEPISLKDVH